MAQDVVGRAQQFGFGVAAHFDEGVIDVREQAGQVGARDDQAAVGKRHLGFHAVHHPAAAVVVVDAHLAMRLRWRRHFWQRHRVRSVR